MKKTYRLMLAVALALSVLPIVVSQKRSRARVRRPASSMPGQVNSRTAAPVPSGTGVTDPTLRTTGGTSTRAAATITVNPDGTFSPPSVNIRPGDTVRWENLGRTDSIVQIAAPDGVSDVCGIIDNKLAHRFVGTDPNEFTGPARYGVSGVFALGPNGPGFKEVPASDQCDCERNGRVCVPELTKHNNRKLCPEEGAAYEFLPETWANPDITGVTIRLNWSDIQKDINGRVQFVWNDLDRQMSLAVENGKLFTLDVRAGADGTPDWIFTNYAGPAPPGPVTPLFFKDWADGQDPPRDNCGFKMTLGSPSHISYLNLYVAMIKGLADHVAADSRWFQALAHVKVSGANFTSSEARMPKRCFDGMANLKGGAPSGPGPIAGGGPTLVGPDGMLDNVAGDPCLCNTQRWAEASYTPEGLYRFYSFVENAIYEAFFQRKSMGYQLIQDGFPKVTNNRNFQGDTLRDQHGNPLLLPAGTTADDLGAYTQTEGVLARGRKGTFVNPNIAMESRFAGLLFVPQHSGLQTLPDDEKPHPSCVQHQEIERVYKQMPNGLIAGPYYRAHFPSRFIGKVPNDDVDGCPNPWAVREGLTYGQIMGFQTTNSKNEKGSVGSPKEVESALWNLTINSNGVFVEFYEERLWEIYKARRSGPSADPLSPEGRQGKKTAPHSKNLNEWVNELHDRRAELAKTMTPPYLADPFPAVYEYTFSNLLIPRKTYYFINPAKCAGAPAARRVGSITIASGPFPW